MLTLRFSKKKLKFRLTCEFDGTPRKFNLYTKLRQYLHGFSHHVGKCFFTGFQEENSLRREFCRLRTFWKTLQPKRRSSQRNKRFQLNSIVNFCQRNKFSSYHGMVKTSLVLNYRRDVVIASIDWFHKLVRFELQNQE